MNKTCRKCHKEKDINNFYSDKNRKDGTTCYCKDCQSKLGKEWRKNSPRYLLNNKEYYKRNKEKIKTQNREWVKNNIEKVRTIKRRHYEANKEKLFSKAKLWAIENPEKRRLIVNAGMAKRRRTIRGNLNHRMSVRINEVIRINKNRMCWKSMVDYTLDELKQHLEKQFLPGMTWENRNLWHIDHVIPISAFNFNKPEDEDFKRCWSLENLQPLWAADNIRKSNHFDCRANDGGLITFTK